MGTATKTTPLTEADLAYLEAFERRDTAQTELAQALLATGRSAASCAEAFEGTPAQGARTTFDNRLRRARAQTTN